MPRRKSLDQLRAQATRLRREAYGRNQSARAGRIEDTYSRYANNIRDSRRFQRDRDLFLRYSREARRAEAEDIDRASALYDRATRTYTRAMSTPVPRSTYMGLNNG